MPRLIDYGDRGDLVLEAVRRVIVEQGVEALTLRTIAERAGLSHGTILFQFENRARLLRVAAVRTGSRRVRWISHLSDRDGVLAFLPGDGDERHAELTRAWLAFVELGRSDDDLGAIVAHHRQEEREVLACAAGADLDEPALDALAAVVEGLTAAMFARSDPLPLERARAALQAHLNT